MARRRTVIIVSGEDPADGTVTIAEAADAFFVFAASGQPQDAPRLRPA
jgi:hypothetical protein